MMDDAALLRECQARIGGTLSAAWTLDCLLGIGELAALCEASRERASIPLGLVWRRPNRS